MLLSGDQVLPTITPHISGPIAGDPLLMYIESLDRLSDLPDVSTRAAGAWPALPQSAGPGPRRSSATTTNGWNSCSRSATPAGWASVIDLSHELFAARSWGSMAEAETFAHLERLRATGAVQRREEAGILLYHL